MHEQYGWSCASAFQRDDYPNNTNRAFKVYELPPSFRFPPLREGNREGRAYSVLRAGGTLQLLFFVNFGLAIGISVFAVRFKHSPHPNPPRGRGGSRGSSPVHGGGWEG
jgi:hypothetical protein